MNDVELFTRALELLVKVSALIQPTVEPGTKVELEAAFMWNHANNVAMLGTDFQILIDAGSFSAPALVARTMMEGALILSAGAVNPSVMREKLDYDLRRNLDRLEKAEKELKTNLTKEKQTLDEQLKGIRAGSTHFLQIAKLTKCD